MKVHSLHWVKFAVTFKVEQQVHYDTKVSPYKVQGVFNTAMGQEVPCTEIYSAEAVPVWQAHLTQGFNEPPDRSDTCIVTAARWQSGSLNLSECYHNLQPAVRLGCHSHPQGSRCLEGVLGTRSREEGPAVS